MNSEMLRLISRAVGELNDEMNAQLSHAQDPGYRVGSGSASGKCRPICQRDLDDLKLLTYNVWFNEEAEVETRMEAILDEVKDATPHFLALQEVTPIIWSLLRPRLELLGYRDHKMQTDCPYFVVLLSRVRVSSFVEHYYEHSSMSRCLIYAECEIPNQFRLRVGTSHLESPVPPFSGQSMNSNQRKQQLHVATRELCSDQDELPVNMSSITVLMGDLNWSEKNDGSILTHTGDGWSDVCAEAGFTYDAVTNGMLFGKLQGRLDRILVRADAGLNLAEPGSEARDSENMVFVSKQRIVGKEPIPDAKYEKKLRNGRVAKLPLFPSDHYGLVAHLRVNLPKREGGNKARGVKRPIQQVEVIEISDSE